MTRSLLNVTDLTRGEVLEVLEMAALPVDSLGRPLGGQGVALIFEKPSNRTRHSMEMAVVQLGGHPVYTRADEVGFDVRESVEDIARTMDGYHSLIAARVFEHSTVERLAAAALIPVMNLLSDVSHPLQAFADALTMQQCFGELQGRTVAWVGDFNNVARSLAEICSLLHMHIRIACPPGFCASDEEIERIALLGALSIGQSCDPVEAVTGADAVHTDTWVSMGQESEKQARVRAFDGFLVDDSLMSHAAPEAVFMHCLPAYRGLEVSASVIDGPRSVVFQQGHNRLHSARAVIAFLLDAQTKERGSN